ncbi:hypothetical protein [Allocoleopsis sp.]|uniref:hypothetical protein n=1 Tax=Allocoleopsis sp. TaxID=3088169 RepID=UPI002FD36494
MSSQGLNIRLPSAELKILEAHCQVHRRTKTDVLREFIRSLDPNSQSALDTSATLALSGIDWQQVALANLQLYCRLASNKFFFETDLNLELDGLRRLILLWLQREDVPLDQKRALIQTLAQLLDMDEIRQQYLEPD